MTGDWRTGQSAISYGLCRPCGDIWYFTRPYCPRCGSPDLEQRAASGAGVVVAVTRVERAPSADWRALLPYTIVLVDAAEGFRLMAHAAPNVGIGDSVRAGFRPMRGALLPYFEKTDL